MTRTLFFALILTSILPAAVRADRLVLVAGGGTKEEGPAKECKLIAPFGVDFDKPGDMYIVELTGNRLLKVDSKAMLRIVAGTGVKGDGGDGGPALDATFNGMHSLAISPSGHVFLADTWNNRVRVYYPKSAAITAFAGTGKKAYSGDGGPAIKAEFTGVFCVALDFDGKKLYVTDLDNRRIRAIDMKSGVVDLVAGSGKKGVPDDGADAKTAPLVDPRAAAVDRQGNVYILERSGHALRVVDPIGKIRTVAGTGKAGLKIVESNPLQTQLNGPKHLCFDLEDNVVIADTANHRILKYSPRTNRIVALAGSGKKGPSGDGGPALETPMNEPHGVHVRPDGTLYIVDSMNHRVFRLEK